MSRMSVHACPRCQIGRLHVTLVPYTRIQNGLFLSIPDVQTFECDVCGFQEVDDIALLKMESLIDDIGIGDTSNRAAAKLPSVENESADNNIRPPRLK